MVEKVEEDAKAEVDVNKPIETVFAAAIKLDRNKVMPKAGVEVIRVEMFSSE